MSRSPKALSTHNESNAVQEQLSLFAKREIGELTHTEEITITGTGQPELKQTARAKKNGYSAADIQVLEGIAAIRHRPGMYIGSTSTSALFHLICEALDNPIDEAASAQVHTPSV